MPLPFDQFMQRALHDPKTGYYARRITGIGNRGDFTTAPMLSDALAKAIAAWATKALRETGCRNLIEIGPGDGTLSAAVWKHLPWMIRLRTQLHLVETSPPLTDLQQTKLGKKATWHTSPAEALDTCDGNAVIFSNELVDAFSVRRFERTTDGWQEIAVSLGDDEPITESLLPVSPLPDSTIFQQELPIGQRVEVHQSYKKWLESWLDQWKNGRLLTIDYGDTADTLYHRRPNGTLRAYLLQHRLEGMAVYDNIGRQDITCDVNFTDLIQWSKPWTSHSKLTSMAEFMSGHTKPTDHQLTDPQGAGTAFKTLEQSPTNNQAP